MTGDLHIHMILDGVDFRAAIGAHRQAPDQVRIRQQLECYQKAGFRFLRDGGDAWGVGLLAAKLAPEYGLDYRSPGAPYYKQGHYGGFIGKSWNDLAEFRQRVAEATADGADFIKIMISGLMDFRVFGRLTEPSLTKEEITSLIAIAHDAGFSVMAHCNGSDAVLAAVEAGVDSVEHGAYMNDEACCALAQSGTVWVPTLSTVGNLLGNGRFEDGVLQKILAHTTENVRKVAGMGGIIGCGSDAGAFCVAHGMFTEEQWLQQAVGADAAQILAKAQKIVEMTFNKQ